MKEIGKYSYRNYKCTICGTEKKYKTNHWDAIYPYCIECNKVIKWECQEPTPKGYKKLKHKKFKG